MRQNTGPLAGARILGLTAVSQPEPHPSIQGGFSQRGPHGRQCEPGEGKTSYPRIRTVATRVAPEDKKALIPQGFLLSSGISSDLFGRDPGGARGIRRSSIGAASRP